MCYFFPRLVMTLPATGADTGGYDRQNPFPFPVES